jgi:bifunctional DNA-binding transcriptional regulator/antitoxin component of YhaV-PrlF toxin-antitoxin module
MSTAKKLKNLQIDERGRITLPKELREGISSFDVVKSPDGALKLVPLKSVSLDDVEIIESLKTSLKQFKAGKTSKMPKDWVG